MGINLQKLKVWGQARNSELDSLGLSKAEINGWWSLSCKKEVSPKQYAYLLFDKDIKWDMLLSAKSKSDLKRLKFPLLHLPYPVAMHLIGVIGTSLLGHKPVKEHILKMYLRTKVDAPCDEDGVWSF